MSGSARPRGGILWDLFLIVVVLAGAAALWVSRGRWSAWRFLPRRAATTSTPAAGAENLLKQSAAVQAEVRGLLAEVGVAEADLVKTYNAQRSDGEATWVESTIELRASPDFGSGEFLKRLLPLLARRGLAVVTDEAAGDRWLLELGVGDRVFQRLVFRTGIRPPAARPAGKGT